MYYDSLLNRSGIWYMENAQVYGKYRVKSFGKIAQISC